MPFKFLLFGARQDDRLERPNEQDFAHQHASTQTAGSTKPRPSVARAGLALYHLRMLCCILEGDTEGGGLDMVMPVAGLTMGMALRARVAEGW